jgi:anaerobic selenocysteine-containing dehydrogenase
MSNSLTRRQFLQVSAMAAAAWVVSGCTVDLQRTEYLESYVQPPEEELPGENLWYASTCRQCPAGCGILVRVSNGRARKIEGNPLHPLNRGKLCARGQAALQGLYDPDRLRNAVRQVGRGTQTFEPVYWEDTLASLSAQMRNVDPAAVAFLGGNLSSHLWTVISRFAQALGARPPVVYTLGDELSGHQPLLQASSRLFGADALPLFDVASAEVVFSFGANFLETWLSPVYYSRAYAQMRRGPFGKRGYLVQFEPRLSSTAACADEWVPIRPGTEGLVALGLGKILADDLSVAEGGQSGTGQHASLYREVDVAGVADASGVSVDRLERLARVFGTSRGIAIPGAGVTSQQDGSEALRAVYALNHVARRLGQPGGVYLSAGGTGDAFRPPPVSSYAEVRALVEDMLAGRVQVLFVHGTNPLFELPPGSGFSAALSNVPLVVSFSPTVDETAVQADWILPDHTDLEGWGYHVPAVADRLMVSGQQPVMQPLYDTRASVDVLLALARELGGRLSQALPWPNEVDFLEEAVSQLQGSALPAEASWAQFRRQGGYWSETEAQQVPTVRDGFGEPLRLSSPPLPATPALEADPGGYPYALHLYPSIALFDGRGANKPWLQETPDPMTTVAWQTWIEIDPATAKALGVEDGDIVRVISRAGEIEAIVYLYPGLREGVVAMATGRGHEHYGRFAKGYGSNPLRLVASAADEGSGALAWGITRVRIVATGRRTDLARLESAAGMAYLQEEH